MIYLCRHGQTFHNREGRLQGRSESDLTPLGRAQAAAMGDMLFDLLRRDPPADWRIVASPLRRARDTAEAIGARLGLSVTTDERLVEIDVGEWSNRLREDVRGENPHLVGDDAWGFHAPGGETYEAMMARITDWLDEQVAEPERRLIVVSHGVAGRLLRGVYAGLSKAETLHQDIPQDAVYRLMAGQVDRFDCEPV
ncbi:MULTISPECIES: histidine phosphatase family protein [Caulobacter]|jgi:broad specificity phosphatase PhoE|uniref:Fructose-2,6-bisphosphatase n=1 Tax=Caulobacter vibrioides OR37 TaxID=1292034 RepID=R0E3X4_CAUVI|nr:MULTISPECIES: histidine phosphatase family protein [Caulobacter]ENZ80303.1 fructose-2,6-bisphosphatase [Caulobacter vibrioides OR37]MBQ1563328.1 histidine phosphatase family protein [Caulobacter sp.]